MCVYEVLSHVGGVLVTYKMGFDWIIVFIDTLYTQTIQRYCLYTYIITRTRFLSLR
jgi:hypothetical protein